MKKTACLILAIIFLMISLDQASVVSGAETGQDTAGNNSANVFVLDTEKTDADSSTVSVFDTGLPETGTGQDASAAEQEKPVKKNGWVKQNGKKYYYKKGKKVTGLKKIKGSYYYFSKRGVLRKKSITVDGMRYLIRKNGKIYGYVMKKKVTPICQQPELPSGCEIVAWTMMVRHAGVKMNKMKAVNLMPRASNPNAGFVGSPFSSHGYILVVYPGGLMNLTRKYLDTAVNMTGKSEEAIQKKLRKGHIVMAWVAGLDGFGSHTIALTGYDDKKIYYNDPWTGSARTMPWSTFRAMWAGNGRRALSY